MLWLFTKDFDQLFEIIITFKKYDRLQYQIIQQGLMCHKTNQPKIFIYSRHIT